MFLTPSEIGQLTGKRTKAAQRRALGAMGVPFATRPDGFPLVLKASVEKLLDPSVANAIHKAVEPDWRAI